MWTVYVIRSLRSGKTYTGITENLDRRLKEHNAGKSKFTSGHTPWQLIYQEDGFETAADARIREKYFKSGAGRRYLKKQLKENRGSPPDRRNS